MLAGNNLYGFAPDARRAAALDQRVRNHLADSLGEISDAIGCDIGFGPASAAPVILAVRQHPVSPKLFGFYTDLVDAALREDAVTAAACAGALPTACDAAIARLQPLNLNDADLGPGQADRYRRLVSDEPALSLPMHPVDATERARAEVLISHAIQLLDTATPEVAGELRFLISQVILVQSAPAAADPEALVFDGASTFYLWGALFLNSARQHGRVSMAVALVHEAAHSLLFGMTLGAPLVENDPSQRFTSPLRHDPRPMDGLVHATYVLARMIDCLEHLLASRTLSADETIWAARALDRHRREYASGFAVVTEFARFTSEGGAIFDTMRESSV